MKAFRKWGYYLWSIVEMLVGFKNWPLVLRIFLLPEDKRVKILKLRKSQVGLVVRGRMDVWSVKETFLDQFYTRYGTEVGEAWVVVDIGAAIGEFTVFAALAARQGRVLAFEPFRESFKLLQENIKANELSNVKVYNEAVWGEAGLFTLDLSGREPLQAPINLATSNNAHSHYSIQAITLKIILEENKLDRLDLLKLDCEGAEYSILMQSPAEVLARVERIIMEFHDGFEGHVHGELEAFLEKQGFEVRVTPNMVHDEIGYLYAKKV